MNIWALSGFLGLPQDWDIFHLEGLIAKDWQSFNFESLPEWASHFNREVRADSRRPGILMGYSLGGRLALHALIQDPTLWKGAVIISAHPGLTVLKDREKRMEQDRKWAIRFQDEEWKALMQDWNAQSVFAHDLLSFDRIESHYCRDCLANALVAGTLGKQEDLRKKIAALPMPILWITGSLDVRYCELAASLTLSHPKSRWKCNEGVGHRVPWSKPDQFLNEVTTFLRLIQ